MKRIAFRDSASWFKVETILQAKRSSPPPSLVITQFVVDELNLTRRSSPPPSEAFLPSSKSRHYSVRRRRTESDETFLPSSKRSVPSPVLVIIQIVSGDVK